MIYPVSILKGKRSEKAKSRINWIEILGQDQPSLYWVMKRVEPGQKALTINKPIPKKGSEKERAELGLFAKGKSVSNIYEPDTEHPGWGYGDINNRNDAILTFRNEETGMFTILVFRDLGKQADILFQNWLSGGVSESLPNNKLYPSTKTVTEDD